MKLRSVALGVALGSVWGVSLFIITWISYYTGYGRLFFWKFLRNPYIRVTA